MKKKLKNEKRNSWTGIKRKVKLLDEQAVILLDSVEKLTYTNKELREEAVNKRNQIQSLQAKLNKKNLVICDLKGTAVCLITLLGGLAILAFLFTKTTAFEDLQELIGGLL